MKNPGEQFLHKKDSKLHTSKAVELEMERKKAVGQEVSQKPAEKISDWMKVLERTHLGHREDPEVLERIKNYYNKEYVIKPEDIPESYFENQKRLAREQGHGDIDITQELREQSTEVIIADQKSTLNNWIDYFISEDSDSYPMWSKYWAFTNMLKLSTFDKEKHSFSKRDKNTVAPFPDLNREALAYVVDAVIKLANQEKIENINTNPEFQELLKNSSFSKLYAYAIEKVTPAEQSELLNTQGEWKKYNQGSDHMPLVESLQGHGTGWCTAGESTAETQLKNGDFYVYYSYDKDGKPTVPRAAIRMNGNNQIGEVRGISKDQNLDSYINEVVKKKLSEFPDGQKYEKKESDMKQLTTLENKTLRLRSGQAQQPLNKQDLTFLYEIENSIEGFGYQKDPRIQELRDQRNPEQDMLTIFECTEKQIAHNTKEINKNTKAYLGQLEPDIFTKLQEFNIDQIYTSFPEGKIRQYNIEIGGKTAEQLEKELKKNKINIGDFAQDMLHSKDFTVIKETEEALLIRLKVNDLFSDKKNHTTDEIYKQAEKLGLELCPAEVGPNLRLQYQDQPLGELFWIGMKQISDRPGSPSVFWLGHDDDGLWLSPNWTDLTDEWDPDHKIVFRLRPSSKAPHK